MQNFWRKIGQDLQTHRYFYLIILLLALALMLTITTSMRGADGRNYLRWTHSLVFDQDLHLYNNAKATGGSYKLTPTGFIFERVNIGTALLWLPFYGAAALFLPPPAPTEPYPADTPVQMVWLNFSSWLYPILGCILIFGALRRVFSPGVAGLAVAAMLAGTPLLFYMMTYPMSAHPALVFLSSLLLFLWFPPPQRQPRRRWHYAALGVVIGWTMTVASYNIVFFLLPGFDLLRELATTRNLRQTFAGGLAVAAGGLAGFAPQMITWWFLFGSPFSSPYAGQLFWTQPYLLEVLFSTFHGLFFYAPVLVLVIPGLWWWGRQSSWAAAGLGLTWLALAYIVSINAAWWAGTSFGNRYFLTLTPFFAVGLAFFIQRLKKWALLPVSLTVLWTVGLYLQYLNGVGFTSDSIVYSAAELSRGQLDAFTNVLTILPNLLLDRPWPFVPAATLPLLILVLVGVSRLVYGWAGGGQSRPPGWMARRVIVGLSLMVIVTAVQAGWRGEQAKAALVAQGWPDPSIPVITREVKEVAGKAGLVTRAMYHQQTDQPEKAVVDYQLAAELWQSDSNPASLRQVLGPDSLALPADIRPVSPLAFPNHARLVGYRIMEVSPTKIRGELFWEQLPGDKSRIDFIPLVRGFDAAGRYLGRATLADPFPAYYLPAGYFFRDTFALDLAGAGTNPLWLEIAVQDLFELPLNTAAQPTSGLFTLVDFNGDPATPAIVPNRVYHPGDWLSVRVATGKPAHLQLLNTASQPLVERRFLAQAGLVCLPLPANLPSGDYLLQEESGRKTAAVTIAAGQPANETICRIAEAGFPRRFEPTNPLRPLDTPLTAQIKLAGYDLSIIPQGDKIFAGVSLHWAVTANVARNYQVALRLLNSNRQVVVAHVGVPKNGSRPTSTWLKGEWLVDTHTLEIPPLQPGQYRLELSLVETQTGRPVMLAAGKTTLVLETIDIP